MDREPLYHEVSRGRFGLPAWWFGAPAVAFLYVLLTPRFLPELVVAGALPAGLAAAIRWMVGLLVGVALISAVRLFLWSGRRFRRFRPGL
jgi:hypothetical protein